MVTINEYKIDITTLLLFLKEKMYPLQKMRFNLLRTLHLFKIFLILFLPTDLNFLLQYYWNLIAPLYLLSLVVLF